MMQLFPRLFSRGHIEAPGADPIWQEDRDFRGYSVAATLKHVNLGQAAAIFDISAAIQSRPH